MSEISVEQFCARLAVLCLKGIGGPGLPNKRRDQQIIFKSIKTTLDLDRDYSETEINAAIENWRAVVGLNLEVDHVSLRRHLVDEGYLVRDPAGLNYRVALSRWEDLFEPAIDQLDQAKIVTNALARREERKQQRLEGRGDSA